MKWKNQIWVFDDVVPLDAQEKIKNGLLSPHFPWHFIADVTGGGSRDARPAFSHRFIGEGGHRVTDDSLVQVLELFLPACLERLQQEINEPADYQVSKARTFLQLPLSTVSGSDYDAHHIDLPEEHFAVLYYVCDADGDTVIFENQYSPKNAKAPTPSELKEKIRVTPKQGRAVIFDGYYWHTATQPTAGIRCIINSDIVLRK